MTKIKFSPTSQLMSDLPADILTISGTEFSYTEVNYFTTAKHSKEKKMRTV